MKKFLSLFIIAASLSFSATAQDSMNKKIDNKTDKMVKKMDNKTDKMNKKIENSAEKADRKTDSLVKKVAPNARKPKKAS